jgi:hypothetical protein
VPEGIRGVDPFFVVRHDIGCGFKKGLKMGTLSVTSFQALWRSAQKDYHAVFWISLASQSRLAPSWG